VALAGVAAVGVVVSVEAAVGRVVVTEDGREETGAAVWSAVRDAQPATARVATKMTVAMIRTGRMATPQACMTLWVQDSSLAWAGHSTAADGRRGNREPASTRSRSSIQRVHLPLLCVAEAVTTGHWSPRMASPHPQLPCSDKVPTQSYRRRRTPCMAEPTTSGERTAGFSEAALAALWGPRLAWSGPGRLPARGG
jgi:hypothetical protein